MSKDFAGTNYKGVKQKIKTAQYYITFRDEKSVSRRRLVAECSSAKEAFRVLNETKARISDLKSGAIVAQRASEVQFQTIAELAEAYYTSRDTKDNKHEWNRYKLRVSGSMGSMKLPIRFVDAEALQTLLKEVISEQTGTKLAPKSINVITDSMRAMFNWAIRRDKLSSSNPFIGLKALAVDNERKRILNPSEIVMLIDACDTRLYKLLVSIAFYTGARPVSYLGLKLEDIDVVSRDKESDDYMKPKLIHFSSVKKGKSYASPVGKKLVNILWARLLELSDSQSVMQGHVYLFPSSRYPRQHIAHATVSDNLQPIMDKLFNADVVNSAYRVTLYTIRHSAASHIVAITGNIYTAMKLLNHTSINTTLKYVKSNNVQLQEAVDLM